MLTGKDVLICCLRAVGGFACSPFHWNIKSQSAQHQVFWCGINKVITGQGGHSTPFAFGEKGATRTNDEDETPRGTSFDKLRAGGAK